MSSRIGQDGTLPPGASAAASGVGSPAPEGLPVGVTLRGPVSDDGAGILTPEALGFLAALAREFEPRRADLLRHREERQRALDAGALPDFLAQTRALRAGDWRVASIPADLLDRRVEITGPVERKMIINALNSGASVFMADFEDSLTPTWENVVSGQAHLRDAVRGTITFSGPDGREYALGPSPATLMVRPRGWHLPEKHVLVDGRPVSASLFDFALFFFHNAETLIARGSGPYFYLPKMESHLEARLWNDVFVAAQERLGIPRGSIRATVLIETILAAFEMDEILYELREHSAGLNCGRWDYIFSFIKKLRSRPRLVLPDRAQVTMDRAFLKAYSELLVRICHHRGAHAMGGMAAQIPLKNDPAANDAAMEKVRADKQREAAAGHDGTWVAHPGLVAVAREIFDRAMTGPNQIGVLREDVRVAAKDLLEVPDGTITETGLRTNLSVGVRYLEAWLRGTGCVPLDGLMEDAATAEISRTQIWQWIRHGAHLADGRTVDRALLGSMLGEEMDRIRTTIGLPAWESGLYEAAAELFETMTTADTLDDFMTLVAYKYID